MRSTFLVALTMLWPALAGAAEENLQHELHEAHATVQEDSQTTHTSDAESENKDRPEIHEHHAMGKPDDAVSDNRQEGAQEHEHHGNEPDTPSEPLAPIPDLTDADRVAAFPPEINHPVHDEAIHYFALFDRLEAIETDDGNGHGWEAQGWVGYDTRRLWVRSEGERFDGVTESADLELLYGKSISAWWDIVAGVRHDFGAGPSQSFAAFGIQGLSPYKFEVEATAYLGEAGQIGARLEAEYDTLITNRLILQWSAEAEFYGKDDLPRGLVAGLDSIEAGARLRYEVRREFSPYVGLVWEKRYESVDASSDTTTSTSETRLVAGIRVWF